MSDLQINPSLAIPAAELAFSFSRSPGPGGQNVNKVNSQATLKWRVHETRGLSPAVLQRLIQQNRTRINRAGELVITSHEHREQRSNIEECRDRLRTMVLRALVVPRKRRPTRPTAGSVRRRLTSKKKLSEKKSSRRKDDPE